MKEKGMEGGMEEEEVKGMLENSWNRLRGEFVEFIHWLKEKGYWVGAITNNWHLPLVDRHGDRLAMMRSFLHVYVESKEEGVRKPSKRMFEIALRKMEKVVGREIEERECLFIDDSHANVIAAQSFGFPSFLISPLLSSPLLLSLHRHLSSFPSPSPSLSFRLFSLIY